MTALHHKLLRDLARMWPQLLAAALVMAVGIAALTMSLSTVASLNRAQETYYERYRFPHIFAHLKRAPNSLAARIAEIPGVAAVQTRIVVDVNLDVPGLAEPAVGRLISISGPPPWGLSELYLRRGRFPEPGRAGEVVAGEAFMEAHGLEPGASIQAIINGRLQTLTVVGVALSPEYVYQIRPGDLFPDDKRFGVFWMPYRELAPAFDLDGAFNDVAIATTAGASEPDIQARLDRITEPYGGTGAYGRRDQTSHRYISDEIDQLKGMAKIPPTVFLSAAAFILNIVFSRLVRTQREQIAVLKAFGYTSFQVAWHYVQMVVVVALMGTGLGVFIGWRFGLFLTEQYTKFFRFPVFDFELDRTAVATAACIAVGASVIGTLGAVRRASGMPPAEAMRPESPPDYRATLIERLRLQLLFGPAGRMVLRHLERQPVRAILSCLGIGLALAVLILGSFTHGAINYLIDFQFSTTQRQDMTVGLVEPASPRAGHEIAALPGVVGAEPFRSIRVRLRHGPVARLEAITGLQSAPRLNRVVDDRQRAVPMPPDGLLLSDTLAGLLGVVPGDFVTVEVLEGQRPVREVIVADVVPTFLGTAAYMDIAALNRLMGEGRVVSGAFLSVDPAKSGELYTLLKRTPRIAVVGVKRAALDSFQKTLAENILRMRLFNLVFASTIAFGVIYNSARISLAERAHELATLRILGFTRAEVSAILLGELAVITAAAIPIGLVFGRILSGVAASALQTETHRIPLIINPSTYAFAVTVIIVAAIGSGLVVRRGLDHLDLIEVLKTKG